ncbi:hypothetical protein Golomagni_06391 [Golovinomyces magnicellulatus]|nr:hypothetical protein Golomagni_06391 [Golovinomyces magnicellulatus]
MFIGAMLSLLLTNADKVIRQDGSKVILMKNPSWTSEIMGIWYTITEQPYVLLLFPMFFCSNAFYTYQNNGLNGAHFNARTRALNSLLYWLAQILGAVVNGWALDYAKIRRSTRARISYVTLLSLTFIIWGGGWAWQKNQVTRKYMDAHPEASGNLDWADNNSKSLGPLFLYFFYGFYDAFWQTSIYWYMGALSNSGRKAANLAGFYKGVQSAGAAVFWRLDALKVEYNTLFGATWGMIGGALVIAAPVILLKIQDHVSVEEDLKFSDETIEDVTVARLDKKEHDDEA